MKLRFFVTCFLAVRIVLAQVVMTANFPSELAPGTNRMIEVKINKGAISNFSKYQIDVPANVTLSEGDSKTGNFSFENNRGKIVWVSIPVESEFTVSFKVEVSASASGSGNFVQKFYYLDNGTKKEVEGETYAVNFNAGAAPAVAQSPEPAASSAPATTPASSAPAEPTAKSPEPVKTNPEPVSKVPEPVKANPEPAKVTPPVTSSAPEPRVKAEPVAKTTVATSGAQVFRVQIGAYNTQPPKSKYASAGKATVSNEDGFYKVLIGNYTTREEALKKRDELKNQGFNGFVVAYQNGVRVK